METREEESANFLPPRQLAWEVGGGNWITFPIGRPARDSAPRLQCEDDDRAHTQVHILPKRVSVHALFPFDNRFIVAPRAHIFPTYLRSISRTLCSKRKPAAAPPLLHFFSPVQSGFFIPARGLFSVLSVSISYGRDIPRRRRRRATVLRESRGDKS